MNTPLKRILLLFALAFVALLAYSVASKKQSTDNERLLNIKPTPENLVPINDQTPKRMRDFYEIAIALEKYKIEHRRYPISSNKGLGWDALYNAAGTLNLEWIPDLSPKYIKELPRDPRHDDNYEHQYTYRSNGANYKLIARYPEDCKELIKKIPTIFDDRIKGCNYGIWTPRARKWR